jgi:hypothetical protein
MRDELLAVEQFSCLPEAKVMVADWREDYNERRPHSALAMMAPARFARAWRHAAQEEKVIPLTDRDAPAALLPSPYGLAPQDGGTPTLHTQNSHRLSQQVDR